MGRDVSAASHRKSAVSEQQHYLKTAAELNRPGDLPGEAWDGGDGDKRCVISNIGRQRLMEDQIFKYISDAKFPKKLLQWMTISEKGMSKPRLFPSWLPVNCTIYGPPGLARLSVVHVLESPLETGGCSRLDNNPRPLAQCALKLSWRSLLKCGKFFHHFNGLLTFLKGLFVLMIQHRSITEWG